MLPPLAIDIFAAMLIIDTLMPPCRHAFIFFTFADCRHAYAIAAAFRCLRHAALLICHAAFAVDAFSPLLFFQLMLSF